MDPEPQSIILFFSLNIVLVINSFILCVLLLCSGLISGAEVALFSLTKTDIENDLIKDSKSTNIIRKLLSSPKKTLATILVANNFINIGIVILFASISDTLFKDLPTYISIGYVDVNIIFFLKIVVATFMILLFGEILPKIYASRNRFKFSVFVARPLLLLDTILSPICSPMQRITTHIENKLKTKKTDISVDTLSQALELTNDENTTKQEQKILKGIVSFGNTDTKQVMCPRIDIFALSYKVSFSEVIKEVTKKGFSRVPVYEDNMDTIIGILYIKDLLPHLNKNKFEWQTLLRDPIFVPENKKLNDLMVEFQEKKVHLAVVVDEYGGTSGVVSLEDIIEEIVGDITDEFDDDDLIYSKLDDQNYVFEGKTALKDFYRVLKLEDESIFEDHKGEAESIAGFILEISGGFPKRGGKINFENYVFTIESLDKKRIKRIKVTIQ